MKSMYTLLPLATAALSQSVQDQIPLDGSTPPSTQQPLTLDAIPLLGFGTWNIKGSNTSEAVSWAIQTGYRHIDCAAAYGNEASVGAGIADGIAKAGLTREDLWITSKLWNDHHGTTAPEKAINTTLANLGLTHLDLYHMHWPVAQSSSGSNSIEYLDTWDSMTSLAEKGLTRHIGVSNFSPSQLKSLIRHSPSHPPQVHQMELHPYLQQSKWIAFHQKHGIHVTAYSPLGGTNPTYDGSSKPPVQLLQNPTVTKIAHKRGCTSAQVVLQWGMSRGTSVIPKSQHKDRISENFETVACVLKKKDLEKLDGLGEERYRFNNPSGSWGVELYEGLEDSEGRHKKHA